MNIEWFVLPWLLFLSSHRSDGQPRARMGALTDAVDRYRNGHGHRDLRRELRASIRLLPNHRIDVVRAALDALQALDRPVEFEDGPARLDDQPTLQAPRDREVIPRHTPVEDRVLSLTAASTAPPVGLFSHGFQEITLPVAA